MLQTDVTVVFFPIFNFIFFTFATDDLRIYMSIKIKLCLFSPPTL